MSVDHVCQILCAVSACVKKLHLVKFGMFAWYNVKICIIFSVRFERQKVDKKQTYTPLVGPAVLSLDA